MELKLVRTQEIKVGDRVVQIIGWLYCYKEGDLVGNFATLELPWIDNQTGISCIPPGPGGIETYDIELLESSPSFDYPHYWVKDVPYRRWIKIHRGNYYTQIEGCILIGTSHTQINSDGIIDVANSTHALKELVELVGEEGTIEIKYPDQL